MADLGDLMGSLMSGLIRARRMADEQTAALAEYYRDNPLLEGLSVPRVRVPELTIDLPLLIENHVEGSGGELQDPAKIADEVKAQLDATLAKSNIAANPALRDAFAKEVQARLGAAKQAGAPLMKESVARSVDGAFADALALTKTPLTAAQKETIARDLRSRASAVSYAKAPVPPSIVANIRTADVKERGTEASVVRIRITLREEGLEWAAQASETGGVVRTLQPE